MHALWRLRDSGSTQQPSRSHRAGVVVPSFRNASSSSRNRSGASTNGQWPAFGSTTAREPGMAASSRAETRGPKKSAAPLKISVGAWISAPGAAGGRSGPPSAR
jgi:hypothetical protein